MIPSGVRRVVALLTDKSAAPINPYGASKLCSDKLFVAAKDFRGSRTIRFAAVRYGNVMGSRGSVIPFFLERRKTGVLPITDPRMSRFNITLDEGVDLVLHALERMWGGEIYVPRIPSYRITDVADAIGPECDKPVAGIRAGEKLHEEMITETDGLNSLAFADHFVIKPTMPLWSTEEYCEAHSCEPCVSGFRYSSGANEQWMSVDDIRDIVVGHVDPHFAVRVRRAA